MICLNSIYDVDLKTYHYQTGYETDLHSIAQDHPQHVRGVLLSREIQLDPSCGMKRYNQRFVTDVEKPLK